MRELARLAAALIAAFVIARNAVVAGPSGAMTAASVVAALLVGAALLVRWDGLVTGSALGLGLHYLLALSHGNVELDLAAPVVAAVVLAYLEVGDLVVALPADRRVDALLARAALRRTGATAAVALAGGSVAYAFAAVPWPAGEAVRALGVLGVVAVVAVPAILLRQRQ